MKNYYYILGVNENATKNEIKTAYRKLSKKFHPDVNDGDKFFESRFKEINEAYEILNDDQQRIIYDLNRKKGNYKYTKNEAPIPSIQEFYLSKNRVCVGEEIELKWNVNNCVNVTINIFGKVEPVGSKKIIFNKPKNKILVKITGNSVSYGSISKELNIEVLEKESVLEEQSFIEIVKTFLHKFKNIFIILTLLIIGYIIINLNPVTNIKLDGDLEKGIDTTTFTLNGVDPFLDIIINEDLVYLDSSFLSNSKVQLWNYLSKLIPSTTNSKPIVKIIDIDNKEYLFVLYYTGGAHCCFEYQAFKYNSNLRGYYCLGQYSFDASECGEPDDIIYPMVVNTRRNYFHSSYASGQYLECSENNFREELIIKNDSFIIQPIGNSYKLTTCIINFFENTKIPELNNGDDNGERKLILNVLDDLYTLTNSIDKIFFIYNIYMPNVSDRYSLWFEIMNSIVTKQVLEDDKIKEQIEEYKICLDTKYISKYDKLDYSLPEGFIIPTICDIYPESGWEYVRINSGIKEPFHISGDFNGDGLNDHAYFLYSGNLYNYGLFCFFQTKNGYKTYKLEFPGDSDSHPASDYILHEAKRNEFACLYDSGGQTLIEKFKLVNSSIVVSGFEFGDPIVFIYNEANDSFDSYWSCHE